MAVAIANPTRDLTGVGAEPFPRPAIAAAQLGRSFVTSSGTVEAIRDVNLTVDHGEFTVIVGRSGWGKTRLLRLIAGLEQPPGG